jgi:hypothetical protein
MRLDKFLYNLQQNQSRISVNVSCLHKAGLILPLLLLLLLLETLLLDHKIAEVL